MDLVRLFPEWSWEPNNFFWKKCCLDCLKLAQKTLQLSRPRMYQSSAYPRTFSLLKCTLTAQEISKNVPWTAENLNTQGRIQKVSKNYSLKLRLFTTHLMTDKDTHPAIKFALQNWRIMKEKTEHKVYPPKSGIFPQPTVKLIVVHHPTERHTEMRSTLALEHVLCKANWIFLTDF